MDIHKLKTELAEYHSDSLPKTFSRAPTHPALHVDQRDSEILITPVIVYSRSRFSLAAKPAFAKSRAIDVYDLTMLELSDIDITREELGSWIR